MGMNAHISWDGVRCRQLSDEELIDKIIEWAKESGEYQGDYATSIGWAKKILLERLGVETTINKVLRRPPPTTIPGPGKKRHGGY